MLQHLHDPSRGTRTCEIGTTKSGTSPALLSWGIALFEYIFQVPANRLGYETLSLAQLQILQEIITLSVFAPFAVLYMHQPIKLDYLWSGLCLAGAAHFMFRS